MFSFVVAVVAAIAVLVGHIIYVVGGGDAVDVGRHAVTSWQRVWKRINVA